MTSTAVFRLAALGLAALVAATPMRADMHMTPPAKVEVLPGWRQADGTHMAALHVQLEPGWKTYWRAPGDAGIPPQIDWSGSDNIAEVRFHWPVPELFDASGLTTLGYAHELVLPIEVVPDDPAADVHVEAGLLIGVCQDICMPMEAEITAVLAETSDETDRRIARALAQRPDTAQEAGVVAARCAVSPIVDGVRVTAEIEMPAVGSDEFTVIEPHDPTIWVAEAVTRREGPALVAIADMVAPVAEPFPLDTETLRLTVLADGRAVDVRGCAAAE